MALSPVRSSPPCEVRFAGWVSDTYTLGRCGWNIAMHENCGHGVMEMMLHHRELKISGFATIDGDFHSMQWRHEGAGGRLPTFTVRHLTADLRVNHRAHLDNFSWADTEPSMMMLEEFAIHTLPLFAELEKPRAEELIVEPADVSMLLEQIKRMQAPGQKRIRDNERRADRNIHASIVSFKEAA